MALAPRSPLWSPCPTCPARPDSPRKACPHGCPLSPAPHSWDPWDPCALQVRRALAGCLHLDCHWHILSHPLVRPFVSLFFSTKVWAPPVCGTSGRPGEGRGPWWVGNAWFGLSARGITRKTPGLGRGYVAPCPETGGGVRGAWAQVPCRSEPRPAGGRWAAGRAFPCSCLAAGGTRRPSLEPPSPRACVSPP